MSRANLVELYKMLGERPELKARLFDKSRELDEEYANEKIETAKKFGIELDPELVKRTTKWTGLV